MDRLRLISLGSVLVLVNGCMDVEGINKENARIHQPVAGYVKILIAEPGRVESVNGGAASPRPVGNKYGEYQELILHAGTHVITATCRERYASDDPRAMEATEKVVIDGVAGHVHVIRCEERRGQPYLTVYNIQDPDFLLGAYKSDKHGGSSQ